MSRYCCEKFKFDVEIDKTIFDYEPNIRAYKLINYKSDYGSYQPFYYCFYCGKILPQSLGEELYKVVKEELGLDFDDNDVYFRERDKLPKEFKTDEWWKKRNLDKFSDNEIDNNKQDLELSDKYCCINIEGNIEESPFTVAYEEYIIEYFLTCYRSKYRKYSEISYCGFCGKKLPKNLKQEWKFILGKDFGIKDVVREWSKIPEEFKTDKWWRKKDLDKIFQNSDKIANDLDKKDIFFPIYRIGIDALLPTDKKLATDICNSLIEEEFSAQDIVDIIQHFYIFTNMILVEKESSPNKSFLDNNYISKYIFYEIREEIFGVIEPKKYKQKIEALVAKHREDIKILAKKMLRKILTDDKEFIKDLEKQGFNKLIIEIEKLRKERLKKEQLRKKEYYWGRIVTSDIIASYFNKDIRIGENKIKMILDGRIKRSIDDPRYQFIPSKKEEFLKMSDFTEVEDNNS